MSRLIFLILLGFLANWWWRNLHRQRVSGTRGTRGTRDTRAQDDAAGGTRARSASSNAKGASTRAPAALPEPMVRCAYCDTHLPVSEATSSGGRHFCNPRHAHDYALRAAQSGEAR